MDTIIALLFVAFCLALVWRMLRSHELIDLQLGILAVFATGYYCLPIAFRSATNLGNYFESDVTIALLMHTTYFVVMTIGVAIGLRLFPKPKSSNPDRLDDLIIHHITVIGALCAVLYGYYVFNTDLTSYAAADRDEFLIGDRGPLAGVIGTFSNLFLATVSAWSAVQFSRHRQLGGLLALAIVLGFALLAITLGQRLAVLTPIITVVAAMMAFQQRRMAIRLVAVGIMVLMIISPLAVFLRSTQGQEGQSAIAESITSFDFGDDAVATSLTSLIQRADLLENTIFLKQHIDATGFVGWQFYYSALISPVPRAALPDKPYVLSDDGLYTGEISSLAWRLKHNGIGSLTAFGAIMAYHQGGWAIMYVDALCLGLLFAWLARHFSNGSLVEKILYISVFSAISVRKVPPSFFDTLSSVLPLLPIWLGAMLAQNIFFKSRSSRTRPA